jgi:hypothetical protein
MPARFTWLSKGPISRLKRSARATDEILSGEQAERKKRPIKTKTAHDPADTKRFIRL